MIEKLSDYQLEFIAKWILGFQREFGPVKNKVEYKRLIRDALEESNKVENKIDPGAILR